MSVSSENKTNLAEDVDSDPNEAQTDELGGSQSGRWLADTLSSAHISDNNGNINTVGLDGLFVDLDFPLGGIDLQHAVKWKRPKEISTRKPPQFIVDGATRMDVRQGGLNDCWFLSAVASLSLHRPLLERVVPTGQSFEEGYNGSFYFRFWQYGEWKEVRVDDLLPTLNEKLIYLSSPETCEFWSPLLEKAYAKLKGGYRALDMGFPHEAMVDMTGGVTEVLSVSSLPRDLLAFLKHLLAKGALVNCANCQGPLDQRSELGIVFRHAYSVTGVEKVKTKHGTVVLVRVHNPWGKTEWEGPWSDMNGPEWHTVSSEEQMRLDRVNKEDGEFWMAVPDFRQNFEVMEVCHLSDFLSPPGSSVRPWHCIMHHGTWVPHFSPRGGEEKHSDGWFRQNPQFYLNLLEEDDDPEDPRRTCSFVVALMQKHHRRRGSNLAIGVHIYQSHSGGKYMSSQDLRLLKPVLCTPRYTQRREVVLRGRLAPGRYVIIASTAQPNEEGEFILRVLTEKGNATIPAEQPGTEDDAMITEDERLRRSQVWRLEPSFPHLAALPSLKSARDLFMKHCNKKGRCSPLDLHNLLSEAIQGGALAGSEKLLVLEHCKSLVVLMDTQGLAQLDWPLFQTLWDKIRRWTDIFLMFDKNKSHRLEYREVSPALQAAGMTVDEFVLQLIGLRYTEPDMTISYPGFLYLMMKLDSMISKFQAFDMVQMGSISISYRQWLHMTMYN